MKVVFVSALLFVRSLLAAGADAGEIDGRVLNAQGAALPGVEVTVAEKSGDGRWNAVTGPDGSYSIGGLRSGLYTVTVFPGSGQAALRRQVSLGEAPARADFRVPAAAQQLAGADERNPNIFVYRIDLNDLRNRLTLLRGADATYLRELRPTENYFGAEFGAPLFAFEGMRPRSILSSWHGSLSGLHQNSALNARNFFNVGPLLPSRSTNYDLAAEGPLLQEKVSLLINFGQTFTSGWVNGNVHAPFADERAPRSTNAQINSIIGDLLKAFPADLPNLRGRQLNSNATRDIAGANGLARLDLKVSDKTSAALRYFVNDSNEDPFQVIKGQNPRTELRFQGVYTNLTHTFSPNTVAKFGLHYDRTMARLDVTKQYSDLFQSLGLKTVPDIVFRSGNLGVSNSAGLGPGKQFPRFRVQNRFQFYSDLTKRAGRHSLTAGWGIARAQVNDLQSDNARGLIVFTSDRFPGDSEPVDDVTNFLRGTPSSFTLTLGNLYRGFRNWEHYFYFGDQIQVAPTFSLSLGVRYELMTAPSEVNHLTDVAFPTAKRDFAPRFGFAWNPGKGKTTFRGAYGISYGSIFPVSYGMARFNPPGVGVLQLNAPNLLDVMNLLRNSSQAPAPGARSALYKLSPDLKFPYSHQYSFGIERELPGGIEFTVAYLGTRSFHLLEQGVYNRPDPDPRPHCSADILDRDCNTTKDINLRRPDPRYFDINLIESNSIAYYDAGQVAVSKRLSRGLALRAAYTFSKNIDLEADFTETASGAESRPETVNATCERCPRVSDEKGLSAFDTPHALAVSYSYSLPFAPKNNRWGLPLLQGWQISGSTVFQSGTPFHVRTGSDAPGFGNVDGNTQDRPNILNPALLGKSVDNPDTAPLLLGADTCKAPTPAIPYLHCKYFDANIPVGGRGNLGRNTFRKDRTWNTNFALGRTFRLRGGGERSLQFRSEFYNLFNRPQFDKPGNQLSSETVGQITNTVNKGRQVQFSLKLNF